MYTANAVIKNGKYIAECPMCGKKHAMVISQEEEFAIRTYIMGAGHIQMIVHMNPVEREFIMSGYCPDCQKMLFGNGATKRIAPYTADNIKEETK